MKNNLKKKVSQAPDRAGIYVMKDSRGKVLYVGKAKSLKKRLATYHGRDLATKTVSLMARVAAVEWKICKNESMALLLESSLIKKYRPKYNISLRDDKSFPMVKITGEDFPRVSITRKKEADGARYFGPYTNAGLLKEALKIIRRHFPYRSCRQLPRKACIYYRIGLSPAPCIGKISKKEYARLIRDISLILEGKTQLLVKRLSRRMKHMAQRHNFEEAARIRDHIRALSALENSQQGYSSSDELEDLRALLGLKRAPLRIEAFDISNIHGNEATGSLVSFFHGRPDKNNYRRFRIKGVAGIDDFAMTAEVVNRRYSRLIKERKPLPDLVIIDGGKGHLASAKKVCDGLHLSIPLVSIAKEFEHIYLPGAGAPIRLPGDTPALNLIRRIRDEAHRFAVAYHRLLRSKKLIGSSYASHGRRHTAGGFRRTTCDL